MRRTVRVHGLGVMAVAVFATAFAMGQTQAATISWKGHTWTVTGGGMAGVCQGSASNISVDASGYLHMKITNNGGTWTAAEIFSTDSIGFGTYQWQIEGAVDKLDKNVVVGLYPYGPAAGMGNSGNNEIDIEFARWGNAAWPNGNYTIWPPTGSTSASQTFDFSLGGSTSLTTRFVWSGTKIDFTTLSGFEPVTSTTGLVNAWTFAPANPTTKITQQPMPLGMNLWCYDNPPSDGKNVEIVVRDFQFVPLGTVVDGGTAGTGGVIGTGGVTGTGGVGSGGARGTGGLTGLDAGVDAGAAGSTGGSTSTGGSVAVGGSPSRGGTVGVGGALAGGGAQGAGGKVGSGGSGGSGGPVGTGGSAAATGGAMATAGAIATGGSVGSGGTLATIGGSTAVGGAAATGGALGAGGSAVPKEAGASSGCSCRVAGQHTGFGGAFAFTFVAMSLLALRRRREGRYSAGQ